MFGLALFHDLGVTDHDPAQRVVFVHTEGESVGSIWRGRGQLGRHAA